MAGLSGKKLLLLGFIIVLLVIIPLTVYLVQQQQKITTQAAQTSILSVTPASHQMTVGNSSDFRVSVNPVSNQVSFVKVSISYDPTKLETSTDRIAINSSAFQPPLAGPTVSNGTINFTLSVGSQPSKVITQETLVATIAFKALAATTGGTTPITINRAQSQVLSIASSDQFNENVLAEARSASVTIVSSAQAASPSPSPSASPSPSIAPTASPSPSASPTSAPSSGGGTGTGTIITVSPTPTPIGTPSATINPFPTPTPIVTELPSVGPSDFLAKIGGAAALFTVIGLILLLAL
jgi:hypothetical protein